MILVCSTIAGVLRKAAVSSSAVLVLGLLFTFLGRFCFLVLGFMLLPCSIGGSRRGRALCGKRSFPQKHAPYYRKSIGILSKGLRHKLHVVFYE